MRIAFLVGGLWLAVLPQSGLSQTPDAQSPQLKVFDNYVGTWDLDIRVNESPVLKGTIRAERILDGRYLRQIIRVQQPEGEHVLTMHFLMTWDEEDETYRNWVFVSNGETMTWDGRWNAESRSMSWKGTQDQRTLTLTSEFAEPGLEKWTLISLNQFGQQGPAISGTSRRREPPQ